MTPDPKNYSYGMRVLVAIDQCVNVIFGGNADETISARTGREAASGVLWARGLKWVLDKIQTSHTDLAIEDDKKRADEIAAVEQGFEDKHGAGKPGGSYIADHLRK